MTINFTELANLGVQQLQPYQPGKPVSELERELGISGIVKLASNENPLPLPASVQESIQDEIAELARYPDANGYYLKSALAENLGVKPEQITLGNGSNDVLDMVARTFVSPEHEIIFSEHAFVVYPIVTRTIGATAVVTKAREWGHDLSAMAEAITDKTRLIFIANPNNPTGTALAYEELKAFMHKVPPSVLVVVDEAYYEYVAHEWSSMVEQLVNYPNLVVTRTFSKAYGLAGLRVGYSVSNPEIAGLLNRIRQPFNNNNLALATAQAVLKDSQFLQDALTVNREGMQTLTKKCDALGLTYIPSKGNFLTIDFKKNAQPVNDALLRSGVIVRPIANYGMPNHLRVSIGLEQENEKFMNQLPKALTHL
ncbi:MAG: histidinol-phosphate transaminase [Pseudomonadota bacterium]